MNANQQSVEAIKPRPAASVMLLRDGEQGLEVLMLRRNPALKFAPGTWVFPGGAIEQHEQTGDDDILLAAQSAAVREAAEECGLVLAPESLTHFCHWTTPTLHNRRFATWFFVASVEAAQVVQIDGSEIVDYRWLHPSQALALNAEGEMPMMPPGFICLRKLRDFSSLAEALQALRRFQPYRVAPRLVKTDRGLVALYPGDAGYETADAAAEGARHRCQFSRQGLRYLHSGADVGVARMDCCE